MKKIINYIKSLFKRKHKYYVVLGQLHKFKERDYVDWILCTNSNLQDSIQVCIDRGFLHIQAYEVKDCVYDNNLLQIGDDINMTLIEII